LTRLFNAAGTEMAMLQRAAPLTLDIKGGLARELDNNDSQWWCCSQGYDVLMCAPALQITECLEEDEEWNNAVKKTVEDDVNSIFCSFGRFLEGKKING
jgi:hypothetical protein